MAIRNIVTEGDEILRKKCREIGEITDRIRTTMEDMLETMRQQNGLRNRRTSGGGDAQNVYCRA